MKTVSIVLSGLLMVMATAAVSAAEPETEVKAEKPVDERAQAAEHVKNGKRLLDLGEYDKAIVEYQAAFDLIPHPQMLFNLGQAYQRKGDKVKAAEQYEKYLAIEAKGSSAKQAFEMLSMLKEALAKEAAGPPPVAKVSITSNLLGDVQINGKSVGKTPYSAEVSPGRHVFEVRSPGYIRHRETLEVKADQAYMIEATLLVDPAAAPAWYKSPWLWGAVGAAAAVGVIAVIITGNKAENTDNDPMMQMMRPPPGGGMMQPRPPR